MANTANPDTVLMLAIMSMDAYNRDKNPNNTPPVLTTALNKYSTSLGDATILAKEYDPNTLFGAVAYELGRSNHSRLSRNSFLVILD
jgi:hypothetical protein